MFHVKQPIGRKSPVRTVRKRSQDLEHRDQVMLFNDLRKLGWLKKYPIFAIPNGGKRHKAVAAKLKSEGVTAGVPDIFVAVAQKGYNGMFIEMKRPYTKKSEMNRPSAAQIEMMARLSEQGYLCVVANGRDEAWEYLSQYLKQSKT